MAREIVPPFARRRLLKLLFLVVLWPLGGAALAGAGLASAYLQGSWLFIPAMVLLPLAGIALALLLQERFPESLPGLVLGFTYVYCTAAVMVGLVMAYLVGRPYLELTANPPLENLRVRDAASNATPGYRHFADGRILADRAGRYIDSGVDSDGYYYEHLYEVAPVVAAGWRASDPITLWVVTGSQEASITRFGAWDGPIQGMVKTSHRGNYWRAVETAVAEHNLRTAPDALLLRLYTQEYAQLQGSFLEVMRLFLVIVIIMGWLPLTIFITQRQI